MSICPGWITQRLQRGPEPESQDLSRRHSRRPKPSADGGTCFSPELFQLLTRGLPEPQKVSGDGVHMGGTQAPLTYTFVHPMTKQFGTEAGETLHGVEDLWFFNNYGRDELYGRGGNDEIYGHGGDDYLDGGSGHDKLEGGSGNDSLNGGSGNDYLDGGSGDDSLRGGSGHDDLNGGSGHDYLYGGTGEDTLRGGDGDDELEGGTGNDRLFGDKGDDTLRGGDGDDILKGDTKDVEKYPWEIQRVTPGNDNLYGGRGNDELYGGVGDDILDGGEGNDKLYAGPGKDTLSGGDGDDLLDAGHTGSGNTLTGGKGKDTFLIDPTISSLFVPEIITDFTPGEDELHFRGSPVSWRSGIQVREYNGGSAVVMGGNEQKNFIRVIIEGVSPDQLGLFE